MKKTLFFLATFCCCLSAMAATGFEVDGIAYNVLSSAEPYTAKVVSKKPKYAGDIVIPASVTHEGITYAVTDIDNAFSFCKITSVSIPESVVNINNSAFHYCSALTGVTIPESVTKIGDNAFSGCSALKSISVPNAVTSVGTRAFEGCTDLLSVTIGESVKTVDEFAFSECFSLTSVTLGASVSSIEGSAFMGCLALTDIAIPESVTKLGRQVFSGCFALERVSIGKSVADIGYKAFADCVSLNSITVEEGNTVYHSAGNCLIQTASHTLVAGCKTSVIPADGSVTAIGNEAFYGCKGLENITIPETVTHIADRVFYDCSGLTSITLPQSVVSIGSSAFYNCTGVSSFTSLALVPPAVGAYAFGWECPLREYCDLFVPLEALSAYQTHEEWGKFRNVRGTGLTDVAIVPDLQIVGGSVVCSVPFHIYNVAGQDITALNGSLPAGIYIVRTAAAAQKVRIE